MKLKVGIIGGSGALGSGLGYRLAKAGYKIIVGSREPSKSFDSINESKRHKSGLALRFPRIHRIRWDKPTNETDYLKDIKKSYINYC